MIWRSAMTGADEARSSDQAVADWYEIHGAGIYRYLNRLLGDAEQAADLLQATFERALRLVARRPAPDNPAAWLYRVATNLAYDALRRRRRLRWLPLSGLEPVPCDESDMATALAVRSCLARLPPRDAEALLLYEYVGLSCAEIGDLNDEPANTVRVRLHRARERFRKLYGA